MNIELFDFSVNVMQALIWQYNTAQALTTLLQQKQNWYDVNQTQFWTDWYNNVFNLQTANAFGLSVWSIILNIPLFLQPNPDSDRPLWGFSDWSSTPINDYKNFGNGNFASGGSTITLSLEEQRLILKLRYFQLTSRGDIVTTNKQLNDAFQTCYGIGNTCWILDGLRMFIVAVFTFNVPYNMRQVLVQYDLIPRSAGVGIEYRVLTDLIWGFSDWSSTPINDYKNFGNGGFVPSFV
jgi:Protein of unknown function (DUF2612)